MGGAFTISPSLSVIRFSSHLKALVAWSSASAKFESVIGDEMENPGSAERVLVTLTPTRPPRWIESNLVPSYFEITKGQWEEADFSLTDFISLARFFITGCWLLTVNSDSLQWRGYPVRCCGAALTRASDLSTGWSCVKKVHFWWSHSEDQCFFLLLAGSETPLLGKNALILSKSYAVSQIYLVLLLTANEILVKKQELRGTLGWTEIEQV